MRLEYGFSDHQKLLLKNQINLVVEMREKILFLEIFQPFAQYRNPFTFYYAQSFPLPPKSTIIGMLQNAVGDWYGNSFGVENWWNLKISIHGGFESIFWSYQQLIKGELSFTKEGIWINYHKDNISTKVGDWIPLYGNLKSQRSPIYQQELFNGHLYIFIKGNENLVTVIKENLKNLKKILYLGRSEDVIFIKNILTEDEFDKVEEKAVSKCIWFTFPTYIKLREFPIGNNMFPVYYLPTEVKFKNRERLVKHKSEITKETERDVKFEPVIHCMPENPVYIKNGEIKLNKIKIDGNIFKIPENWGWL